MLFGTKRIPRVGIKNDYIEIEVKRPDMSLELVDRTFFTQNKEAEKILARQSASQILDDLLYDNPEDIKNGAVNVYARQKGRDIAEITQQNIALVSESKKAVDKVKATVMSQVKEAQAKQAQAKQAQVSSSGSPAPSSGASE